MSLFCIYRPFFDCINVFLTIWVFALQYCEKAVLMSYKADCFIAGGQITLQEHQAFAYSQITVVGMSNLCNLHTVNLFFPSLQLLLFLKGFTESERNKLAMLTGILLANGNISASILNSLFNENLVKEGEDTLL